MSKLPLFFFLLLSSLPVILKSHEVTCQHVDYLWNSNDCCDGSSDTVSCLEYIPKMDLEARFNLIEKQIKDINQRLDSLLETETNQVSLTSTTMDM